MSTHHEPSQNTSLGTGLSIGPVDGVTLGWSIETYPSWKACEDDAINALNAGNQGLFTQVLLQSPSIYSLKLGVLHAAELKWYDSLRTLLGAIQLLKLPTDEESDDYTEHALYHKHSREYQCRGFSSNSRDDKYLEEDALLAATVDGSTQVVGILVEFVDVNFGTSSYEPFFVYVYKNKDEASRNECLQYILPKLSPSDKHFETAAENGDLLTVKYLANKIKLEDDYSCWVVEKAIKNGHDEVAKWIISHPELVPWKKYTGSLVKSAIDIQNYDVLVFISRHVSVLSPYDFGYYEADVLKKFLKDKDQALYKKFVIHPDERIEYIR